VSTATGLETASVLKHPSAAEPLIQMLDELLQLTMRSGRSDVSGRIGMARARVGDPRVRMVVLGEPKKGMSTLVNGLIGAEVSATNSHLSVPVIVEYGDQLTTTIVRSDANGRPERQLVDPRNPEATLNQLSTGVLRAEFTVPHPLLAEGVVLMDAPGALSDDPTRTATTLSMVAAADAVLYVSEARRDYYPAEISYLQRIRQICPTVVCVLNKIDVYPQWHETQQQNRRHLDEAGLEFAIFPVSSGMRDYANRSGDRQLDIESGVPQLIDYLRDHVFARADQLARDAVANDINVITEHVSATLRAQAETLRDPRRAAEVGERLRSAREHAESLRRRSAHWQTALNDGCTELMSDVEHDLRHRLRNLVRDAEADVMKRDPAKRWDEFRTGLDNRIIDAVSENFLYAHTRSVELADQLAAKFPAEGRIVTLPELHLGESDEVLEPVAELEPLENARTDVVGQLLSTLRGSYGGILMVGLATSLMHQNLINWYSGSAGVVLGANAFWEDRRGRRQRRQAEAKVAIARLMDDVVFQVGKESRNRLRAAQRTLRDHFTEIANESLRGVDESLRSAEDAKAQQLDRREERLAEIDRNLDGLARLRRRAAALAD
jgi:hypothetical protein